MAAEPVATKNSNTISSTQFKLTRSQLTPEQRQRMDERLKELATGTSSNNFKVGEIKEVGKVGNDTLYVELANEQNSSLVSSLASSGITSSSQTFVFSYYNFFGIKTNAFQVSLTCNWYKNGSNSYINYLTGTYTVLDSSFSCAWDTASGSVAEPGYQALYMYAYHNGVPSWFIFDALCNTLVNPPYISFGFSQNGNL